MTKSDYDAGWQAGHATGKLIAQQHQQPPTVINYYYGMPPQQTRRPFRLSRLWWLAALLILAVLLVTQHQRLAPLVSQLAARLGSQPLATVNGKPVSELVPTVKAAAVQLAATPQPTDAPAPTEVPTLGTNATVPEAPTGTPERAQEEPQAVIADAPPSATPIPTAAPYVPPTAPPFIPTPAPQPQAIPTATQEPMGQPVANAQPEVSDATGAEFGGPSYWATEAAKLPEPFRNPSMPQGQAPAANVIR